MQIISSTDGFRASLEKSLDDIDPKWKSYPGLLITGTHHPEDISTADALEQIKKARETGLPTLGICFGLHLGVIEFSRNVLQLADANTSELSKSTLHPVIDALPGVRVGLFPVLDLQTKINREENHWHQYKVNKRYVELLGRFFTISAMHLPDSEQVVEEMYLSGHPHFVLIQYHPEYNSTPSVPHPLLFNFIQACKQKN